MENPWTEDRIVVPVRGSVLNRITYTPTCNGMKQCHFMLLLGFFGGGLDLNLKKEKSCKGRKVGLLQMRLFGNASLAAFFF